MDYDSGLNKLNRAQLKRADVNADGAVNSTDGLLILQYIDNAIQTFPACSIRAK